MFTTLENFLNGFLGPHPHNFLGNILTGTALITPFVGLSILASFPFPAFGGILFVAGFMADGQGWARRLVPTGVAAVIGAVVGLLV